MSELVPTRDGPTTRSATRVEAALRLLADPAPAVAPGGLPELAALLVRRGVIDRDLADAALEAIRDATGAAGPVALARLTVPRDGLAARFEEHVLTELGRLPSWYRVRIGGAAGAWVSRNGRSLRVDVRGAAGPWSSAVGRAVVDEPLLLIVAGEPPTGPGIDLVRRRHARLEIMSWDLDGGRLQQVIESRLAAGAASRG